MTGVVGVIWFIAWWLLVYDSPSQHPRISEKEKNYILNKLGKTVTENRINVWVWLTSVHFLCLVYLIGSKEFPLCKQHSLKANKNFEVKLIASVTSSLTNVRVTSFTLQPLYHWERDINGYRTGRSHFWSLCESMKKKKLCHCQESQQNFVSCSQSLN